MKWPNDILIRGKKVGGILAETHFHGERLCLIVGFGLNTNVSLDAFPEELSGSVTSLRLELGSDVDNEAILNELLERLEGTYARFLTGDDAELRADWRELSVCLGRRVRATTEAGSSRLL